tara:strand:+ start:470 stop:1369 length:900 start_codon:yes stop_codon:yes gene_type:complete
LNTSLIPIISIVTPTYNRAEYISKALNSVIDQTFKNWELIIVDNNSSDHTDKIISECNDPRVRYFKINNNGIIAKSRNLGIKVARGEWIAFLDSDDWWTKDKLEICYENINKKLDFIYHKMEVIDGNQKFYYIRNKFKGRKLNKPILNDLLVGAIKQGNAIGGSSVIVRKSLLYKIGGISENKNLVASEDYNTWLRIAQITDQFKYLEKKLGYYLIHDGSTQKKNLSIPHKEAVKDFIKLLDNHQKLNLEVKWKYMSGCYNASINDYKKAKEEFIFVLKNGSINLKLRSLLKIILMIFK